MVKSIEAIDVEVRGLLWKILEFFQTGETEDPAFEAEVIPNALVHAMIWGALQ